MIRRIISFAASLSVMLAFIFLGLTGPALAADIDISAKFSDENFKTAIYEIIEKAPGSPIHETDVATITALDVSSLGIKSLNGVEYFTALRELRCNGNELTSLNISKNVALEFLYCFDNRLKSLDISLNSALVFLKCNNNQLTSLNVGKNASLEAIFCEGNQLTSFNVSECPALRSLWCSDNNLTSLDIGTNVALEDLQCFNNRLSAMDVSKNTALQILYCENNRLSQQPKGVSALNLRDYRFEPQHPLLNWLPILLAFCAVILVGGIAVIYKKKAAAKNK